MFARILGARLCEPNLLAVLCSACISRVASRAHNIPPDVHLPPEDAYRHHRRKQRLHEPTLRHPLSTVLCVYPGSLVPLALHPAGHITPTGESLTDTTAASYGSAEPRLRRPLSIVRCVCPGSPAPLA